MGRNKILFLLSAASVLPYCVQSSLNIDWKIPGNGQAYDTITAVVGDTVTFSYSLGHNVFQHPSGTCDDTDAIFIGSNSPTKYTFDEAGAYTFACDVSEGSHCAIGQIINVQVTDTSSSNENENEGDQINNEEDTAQEGNKENEDEKDTADEVDEGNGLEKYSLFFNPGEEMGKLEFRMKPYKIPRDTTTYINFVFNIPSNTAEIFHVTGGDIINSQPKHLHHFVLVGCTEFIESSKEGIPLNKTPSNCGIPFGAWAVGGDFFSFISLDSGVVSGAAFGIKALSLDVHYTDGNDIDFNYANDGTHAIATDGFRILYTPNLRPQTLLQKPLLHIREGPPEMNLPPNIPRYFYTKTCTVQSACHDTNDEVMKMFFATCENIKNLCSQSIVQSNCPVSCGLCSASNNNGVVVNDFSNNDEYHISAINYHAHLIGREMYATLLPKSNDVPIIDLESKDSWIFDYQVTYPLYENNQHNKSHVNVYPGDKIQVTCVYDSTSRKDTTYFDLSIYDEMCITVIVVKVDTPDFTTSTGSGVDFIVMLAKKSFTCAIDNSSDIWGGSLEENEDARDIWKNHPMTESDCTFPVGTLTGEGFSLRGDVIPNHEVHCSSGINSGVFQHVHAEAILDDNDTSTNVGDDVISEDNDAHDNASVEAQLEDNNASNNADYEAISSSPLYILSFFTFFFLA